MRPSLPAVNLAGYVKADIASPLMSHAAGAGVAGFDEASIAHPRRLVTWRQGLTDSPADELGNRHTKGLGLFLDQGVVLFVEADLGADHVITNYLDDNIGRNGTVQFHTRLVALAIRPCQRCILSVRYTLSSFAVFG